MKFLQTVLCLVAATPAMAETKVVTITRPETAIIVRPETHVAETIEQPEEKAMIAPRQATAKVAPDEISSPIEPFYDSAKIEVEEAAANFTVPKPPPPPKPDPVKITFDNIEFEFDKATLLPEAYIEVAEIAAILKANPDTNWIVEGHTDSTGEDEYNMKLSLKRADAVITALVKIHGIAGHRLTPRGMGERYLIADDSTDAGQQLNRRVVIISG